MLRSDAFMAQIRANDPHLTALDLTGTFPTGATLAMVGRALRHTTHLTTLRLASNALHDDDIRDFLELAKGNSSLRELDLRGNPHVGNITAVRAGELAIHHPALAVIDLRGTAVDDEKRTWVETMGELNGYPVRFKAQAFAVLRKDPMMFEFSPEYDPSDPKATSPNAMRLLAKVLQGSDSVRVLRLDRMCVGEHCLRELLPVFARGSPIERLSLRDNHIGSEGAIMLCEAIKSAGNSSRIEDIDLAVNEIDDEGAEAFFQLLQTNSKIKKVCLLVNRVSRETLGRLHVATSLNCEPSALRRGVTQVESGDPSDTVLDLSGTDNDECRGLSKGYLSNLGATTIAESLFANSTVQTLVLVRNHIGPEGARTIGELLARNKTLTSIDLSYNLIMDEGARHLCIGMKRNDICIYLNVEENGVSEHLRGECAALCHVNLQPLPLKEYLRMEEKCPHVVDLQVRSPQPLGKWPTLYPESVPYILSILRRVPQIHTLILSDQTTIGDEGIEKLCEWITHADCGLRRLELFATGLTDLSAQALLRALPQNRSLLTIAMGGNHEMPSMSRYAVEDMLELNTFPKKAKDVLIALAAGGEGIEAIDFSVEALLPPNAITDDCVRRMCAALKSAPHVHTIDLSGQPIGNRSMGYLCTLMSEHKALRVLLLSKTQISDDGIEDLAKVLEVCEHIARVDLSHTPITERSGSRLLNALRVANRTLASLNVSNTKVSAGVRGKIGALTASNTQPLAFRHAVLDRLSTLSAVEFDGAVDGDDSFDDSTVDALAAKMSSQPTHLTKISLVNGKLTDVGVKSLIALVEQHSSITAVDIRGNVYTEKGGREVVSFLRNTPRVVQFDLSGLSAALMAKVEAELVLNRGSPTFREAFLTMERRLLKAPASTLVQCTSIDVAGTGASLASLQLLWEMVHNLAAAPHVLDVDVSENPLDADDIEIFFRKMIPTLPRIRRVRCMCGGYERRCLSAVAAMCLQSETIQAVLLPDFPSHDNPPNDGECTDETIANDAAAHTIAEALFFHKTPSNAAWDVAPREGSTLSVGRTKDPVERVAAFYRDDDPFLDDRVWKDAMADAGRVCGSYASNRSKRTM